jgi:hypothetical protein
MSSVRAVLNPLESIMPSKPALLRARLFHMETPLLHHQKMPSELYNGEDPHLNRRVSCVMHIKRKYGDTVVGKMSVSTTNCFVLCGAHSFFFSSLDYQNRMNVTHPSVPLVLLSPSANASNAPHVRSLTCVVLVTGKDITPCHVTYLYLSPQPST